MNKITARIPGCLDTGVASAANPYSWFKVTKAGYYTICLTYTIDQKFDRSSELVAPGVHFYTIYRGQHTNGLFLAVSATL